MIDNRLNPGSRLESLEAPTQQTDRSSKRGETLMGGLVMTGGLLLSGVAFAKLGYALGSGNPKVLEFIHANPLEVAIPLAIGPVFSTVGGAMEFSYGSAGFAGVISLGVGVAVGAIAFGIGYYTR